MVFIMVIIMVFIMVIIMVIIIVIIMVIIMVIIIPLITIFCLIKIIMALSISEKVNVIEQSLELKSFIQKDLTPKMLFMQEIVFD